MERFFTADYSFFWALALAAALFLPVRRLIWVLYVRRAEREGEIPDQQRQVLKRRAGITAALLSFVFAYFYTLHLFQGS